MENNSPNLEDDQPDDEGWNNESNALDAKARDSWLLRMREPVTDLYAVKYLRNFDDEAEERDKRIVVEKPFLSEDPYDDFMSDTEEWVDPPEWAIEEARAKKASELARKKAEMDVHLEELRKDAAKCAQMLDELRRQPPPKGVLLPPEEGNRWMTPEERDLVEWFDRGEFAIFIRMSEFHDGTGWLVPYCRWCCVRFRRGFSDGRLVDGRSPPVVVRIWKALDLMEAAAEEGNGRALNALGILHEFGFIRRTGEKDMDAVFVQDKAKARNYYARSAQTGNLSGLSNYARVLHNGTGGKADREEAMRIHRDLAGRGSAQDCYAVARLLLEGGDLTREAQEEFARWIRLAAELDERHAKDLLAAAGGDTSPERLVSEHLIACALEKVRIERERDTISFSVGVPPELQRKREQDREWVAGQQPAGAVVPEAGGRETVRIPNLNSANPSFAARLILFVRDRFGGDAPSIYKAARISRKTYSAIVSNELRPVSKPTAVAFALALRLDLKEAKRLIGSAGFAFSDFLLDDIVVSSCIRAGIHDIGRVNEILSAHGAKTFPEEHEVSTQGEKQ